MHEMRIIIFRKNTILNFRVEKGLQKTCKARRLHDYFYQTTFFKKAALKESNFSGLFVFSVCDDELDIERAPDPHTQKGTGWLPEFDGFRISMKPGNQQIEL